MEITKILTVLVNVLYQILWVSLFARIILSWFPHKETFISNFLEDITDPILDPIKKVIPSVSGIDFSPLIAFFALRFIHIGLLYVIINFIPETL